MNLYLRLGGAWVSLLEEIEKLGLLNVLFDVADVNLVKDLRGFEGSFELLFMFLTALLEAAFKRPV